jgi:hypothetical protein
VHRYLEAINAAKSAIMSRCSFSPSPMSVSTTKPVSAIARANAAGSAPSAAMDMRGMPSAAAICAPVHTVSPSSTSARRPRAPGTEEKRGVSTRVWVGDMDLERIRALKDKLAADLAADGSADAAAPAGAAVPLARLSIDDPIYISSPSHETIGETTA